MQLIIILLATVSVLTFLSGLITFCGSKKGDRIRSAWFFAAAIFATIWMLSITVFLTAGSDMEETIDWHTKWIFMSAILIDIAFLGYVAWDKKFGKILTYLFLVFGGIISILILLFPHLLYHKVILSPTGNSINLNISPLYITYIVFFCMIVPAIIMMLLKQFSKTYSERKRSSDLVIMFSFAISSIIVVISDLILPFLGKWQISWLGPLSLAVTIIAFYYTILRYQNLNLRSAWLKIFSYIVVITSIAIVYMIIFSLVFAALFRGSTPSTEVIVLNFIMILIFLLLIPAINQILLTTRLLISDQRHKTKKG